MIVITLKRCPPSGNYPAFLCVENEKTSRILAIIPLDAQDVKMETVDHALRFLESVGETAP